MQYSIKITASLAAEPRTESAIEAAIRFALTHEDGIEEIDIEEVTVKGE